jgi:hypothetical protein
MRVSMRAAGLTSDRALGPTWTPASKASLRPLRCKLIGALGFSVVLVVPVAASRIVDMVAVVIVFGP